ncbi:type IV pilus modification PilV family protein [Clostridium paraputrificum]|uniref:type IV pilus modification PilV family protein n=1 Tax=Clostridium TaxID=1485 RepID=UPI003D352C87
MKKSKGSILIEVLVAIFILFIAGGIALTFGLSIKKSINNRQNKLTMKESLKAICSELKYNNSFIEVKSSLLDDRRKLIYNEGTLVELTKRNLFDIPLSTEDDNFIEIIGSEKSKGFIELVVKIKYKGEVLEQGIIKSPWMDEV